jgi:hypothetical protein
MRRRRAGGVQWKASGRFSAPHRARTATHSAARRHSSSTWVGAISASRSSGWRPDPESAGKQAGRCPREGSQALGESCGRWCGARVANALDGQRHAAVQQVEGARVAGERVGLDELRIGRSAARAGVEGQGVGTARGCRVGAGELHSHVGWSWLELHSHVGRPLRADAGLGGSSPLARPARTHRLASEVPCHPHVCGMAGRQRGTCHGVGSGRSHEGHGTWAWRPSPTAT